MPGLPTSRLLIRTAAVVLPIGIAANVAFSLATTDRELLISLSSVPVGSVLLAITLVVVPWVTQALRMTIWTRFVGHPIGMVTAIRIYAGGVLGSAVTPTAVGAGSIRWALAVRWGVPGGTAASLFSVEAAEDLCFFLLAVPLALVLTSARQSGLVGQAVEDAAFGVDVQVAIGAGVAVMLVLLVWIGFRLALGGRLGARRQKQARRLSVRTRVRVRRGLRDLRQTLALVTTQGKGWFVLTLVLTAIQWTARYSVAAVVIVALGETLQPVLYWLLSWLTYAVASPAPTPGAAGATEATFILLHSPFVSFDILPLASSVWRLLLFYLPATLAALAYPLFVARDVADERADLPRAEEGSKSTERVGTEPHREGVPGEGF
ncbi:MAG: lysylphosphatidylglycerol synthase transmembrane domain-containing protein [Bacteroidota bacterium]